MRWNVEGADAQTGEDRVIQVMADTKAEAEAKARRQGLLVSSVHESNILTPAEALDEMIGNETRQRTGKAVTAEALSRLAPAAAPPPQPVEYRATPRFPAAAAPAYGGLQFAAFALGIFAL